MGYAVVIPAGSRISHSQWMQVAWRLLSVPGGKWRHSMVHLERDQSEPTEDMPEDWQAALLDALGLIVTLIGVALLVAVAWQVI